MTDTLKKITVEEARQNLENWLDLAAHSSTYPQYDDYCGQAYDLLGYDEYKRIYDRWASGYVHCDDGYYRRR